MLLGIIGFIGNKVTDVQNILGHYKAYIRRNDQWEEHDDLCKKIIKVSSKKIIIPHLLIYVVM